MKKKIFTLLTLLLAVCSGAWATDYVIDGSLTFESNACTVSGQTFTFSGNVTSSQTSDNIKINDKKVLKLGAGAWTITLPTNFQVTRLYIEGMSNNTSNTSTITVGSQTETLASRPSSTKPNYDSGADDLGKLTVNYAIPATGSLSFTIGNKESLIRIVISGYVETQATTYSAINAAVNNQQLIAYNGNATPTLGNSAATEIVFDGLVTLSNYSAPVQ